MPGIRTHRIASAAGCAGAVVWPVGLSLSALAGAVLPSDGQYFWIGTVGGVLGILLLPVAWRLQVTRVVRISGVILGLVISVTGIMLALGARGSLGHRAPSWIAPASDITLFALFVWIPVASYEGWRRKAVGSSIVAASLACAATFVLGLATWLAPYTHTNGTAGLDAFTALLVFASLPSWLVAVSVNLWSGVQATEAAKMSRD